MKDEDVAQYLQSNPQFFDAYAAMLAEIAIPHPYGGRTISLSERQLLTLREKNRELEKKLLDMVQFTKDNTALQNRVHAFTLTLFGASGFLDVQEIATRSLREMFDVPHVALHVWKGLPPSADVLAYTNALAKPVCTHHPAPETLGWFGEAAPLLRSFAYLPLREGNGETSLGLLVLGSEDPERFYPDMGTVFLQRIAEAVSSALRPSL